jgi:hypothetical protein
MWMMYGLFSAGSICILFIFWGECTTWLVTLVEIQQDKYRSSMGDSKQIVEFAGDQIKNILRSLITINIL